MIASCWRRYTTSVCNYGVLREQGLDVSNRVLSVDDAVQAILEGGSHVK